MTRRDRSEQPDFGENERFDERAHRLRVVAWFVLAPALVAGAFAFRAPAHAVPSAVLRAAIVYLFVLAVMRLSGKRTLAELSTFDLVVLLIMSEAVQPSLVADDNRLTTAMLIVTTLVALDALLAFVKYKSHHAGQVLDDLPSVLVRDGVVNDAAMARERIDKDDIMEAARHHHGLESFEQVRFAILERTGGISIIPWPQEATRRAR